eukprot:gene21525-33119_t
MAEHVEKEQVRMQYKHHDESKKLVMKVPKAPREKKAQGDSTLDVLSKVRHHEKAQQMVADDREDAAKRLFSLYGTKDSASDNDDDDSDTVSAFSDEPGFEVTDDGTLLVRKSEGTLAKKNEGTGYDAVKFSNRKAYPHLFKYWTQRYRFWSRFDRGVWMDEESWYSVTPEAIAKHIAERCQSVRHDVVIDGFCGAGGNTIQFAKIAKSVIAFDIDPAKLAIARHNARVYGVDHKIEFILGDFTKMIPTLEADIVFLSPPWGGPRYNLAAYFDLADIQLTKEKRYNGFDLFRDVTHFTARNIIYYLPRN